MSAKRVTSRPKAIASKHVSSEATAIERAAGVFLATPNVIINPVLETCARRSAHAVKLMVYVSYVGSWSEP
jgi:hypothetical protein